MKNKILKELLEICDESNAEVMRFSIYDCGVELPQAVIEDDDGRLSNYLFYEDGKWH